MNHYLIDPSWKIPVKLLEHWSNVLFLWAIYLYLCSHVHLVHMWKKFDIRQLCISDQWIILQRVKDRHLIILIILLIKMFDDLLYFLFSCRLINHIFRWLQGSFRSNILLLQRQYITYIDCTISFLTLVIISSELLSWLGI